MKRGGKRYRIKTKARTCEKEIIAVIDAGPHKILEHKEDQNHDVLQAHLDMSDIEAKIAPLRRLPLRPIGCPVIRLPQRRTASRSGH